MTVIQPKTSAAQRRAAFADLVAAKADAAIAQIDSDMAALPDATNAEVKDMISRALNRQKKIIQAIKHIVEDTGGA